MTLLEALKAGALIADGANGTTLNQLGFTHRHYELATFEAPEIVREAHARFLRAGAQLIETNTFQANRFRLDLEEPELFRLNVKAAEIAKQAASVFDNRFVLGAIGPCGKPVEPIGAIPLVAVKESVSAQARALVEGNVDGFMLETYIDLDEMEVAVEAIRSVSQLPIFACKAFIEDGEAIAEGLPVRAAQRMAEMGVDAFGANCVVGPQRMLDLIRMMVEATSVPVIAMPTPGVPQRVKNEIVYDSNPDYFGKAAARLIEEGAAVVGGCCGSLPEHIHALSRAASVVQARLKPKAEKSVSRQAQAEIPVTPPSTLLQKLRAQQFVTAVEMDVPRGLKIEKLLRGAQLLKEFGVDAVNISDGARARLRMSPAVVAHLIQDQVGIEAVMHFSCRDRNLLAIQADFLGCHALGVRNVLAVTGDPTQVGDYPSATSVFDVDAIGLVRILDRFNNGIDLAGNGIGCKCGFTKLVAFNPGAIDPKLELDRLKRKCDAGADAIYTQPVFHEEGLETCLDAATTVDRPVLVGVLPIKSSRHAEFMHNEVPGIQIPDHLRQQMANAESEEASLAIGLFEAIAMSKRIREAAAGLYLMPPFGNAQIAKNVLEGMEA